MFDKHQWRISAKALLRHQGKYLYLTSNCRGLSVPDVPGGGLEHDESPQEGLMREIQEETGLIANYLRFYKLIPFFQICGTFNLCYIFVVDVNDISTLKLEEGLANLEWVDYDELLIRVPYLRQLECK